MKSLEMLRDALDRAADTLANRNNRGTDVAMAALMKIEELSPSDVDAAHDWFFGKKDRQRKFLTVRNKTEWILRNLNRIRENQLYGDSQL